MQSIESGRLALGVYIKKLRTTKKASSLRQLASAIGVSHNYLSEIERGLKTCDDELIKRIADYFEVGEYLLFRKANRVPYTVRQLVENEVDVQRMLYKLAKCSPEKKAKVLALFS